MDIAGPEPLSEPYFDSLIELIDGVFRAEREGSMRDQYPYFLRPENFENLFICRDGDRVVTHVGVLPEVASFFGHRVEMGMIGAVAAHPDYRGQGLATKTLEMAFQKTRERGGRLMMISGARGLYKRNGARSVGTFPEYEGAVDELHPHIDKELTLERVESAEAGRLGTLQRRKGFRFVRPREQWRLRMERGFCRDRNAEFWMVCRGGADVAYVIIGSAKDEENADLVIECGGAPAAAVWGAVELARNRGSATLHWAPYEHERELQQALDVAGFVACGDRAMEGTQRILNLPGLARDLRGYFGELVGSETADRLQFVERGAGTYAISLGEAEVTVPGPGPLAELLFGDGLDVLDAPPPDELGEVLSELLPLPALKYDFNYV